MEEILLRVEELEKRVLSENEDDNELCQRKDSSLLARIEKMDKGLKDFMSRMDLKEFFKRYQRFNDIVEDVDERRQYDGKYHYLPKAMKVSFIEKQKPKVNEAAIILEELNRLKKYLDVDFSKKIQSNDEKNLVKVSKTLTNYVNEESKLRERVQSLVNQYSRMVNILSRKFLYYDQMIRKYDDLLEEKIKEKKDPLEKNHPLKKK